MNSPAEPTEPEAQDPSAIEQEMALIVEGDLPTQRPQGKRVQAANSVLAAAMLGLGEVIEPHKTEVSIEAPADAVDDDPLGRFDFGGLPPLN